MFIASDDGGRFDADRFVQSVPASQAEFASELLLTQSFSVFIQQRTELLPALAFQNPFDRCLDDASHARWMERRNVLAVPLSVSVPRVRVEELSAGNVRRVSITALVSK